MSQFLPASIESLGPTISLDEAIDLLGFGKTGVSSANLYENRRGEVRFVSGSPNVFAEAANGNLAPLIKSIEIRSGASLQVLTALREGILHAFLTVSGEWRTCFRIPQEEWHLFGADELSARICRCFPCSDRRLNGASPMLAKGAFEDWAARQETPREATGDPGRPELGAVQYMTEFRRRTREGIVGEVLAREAEILHDWYVIQYPGRQAPSVKTIKNRIRAEFNRVRK